MNNRGPKKILVDRNKTTIFVFVAVAAVISTASLVISKGVWDQSRYLGRIVAKKEVATKQLEDNKVAVQSLTEAYKTFDTQSPNLIGGSIEGGGSRDGSNGTLILDSLPDSYDFPALVASVERLLQGYNINNIGGVDDYVAQQDAQPGVPQEMPFTFDVTTSYGGLEQLLESLGRSIRPLHILSIDLRGANSELNVSVSAKTYYQPDAGMHITKEIVR